MNDKDFFWTENQTREYLYKLREAEIVEQQKNR
jgi:hypothetical protein